MLGDYNIYIRIFLQEYADDDVESVQIGSNFNQFRLGYVVWMEIWQNDCNF